MFVHWMLQNLYKGATVSGDAAFHVYVPFSFSMAPYSWSPPWVAHAIEAVRLVSYPISGWVYTSLSDTEDEKPDEEADEKVDIEPPSGQNNTQSMWQLYAKKSLMLSGAALKYTTAPYWFTGKALNAGVVAVVNFPAEMEKERQRAEEERELTEARIEEFEKLSVIKRVQKLRTIVRNSKRQIVDIRFNTDKFRDIYGGYIRSGDLRREFFYDGMLGYYLGLIYWPPYLEKLIPDYFERVAQPAEKLEYMVGHNPLKLDLDITLEDVTGCETESQALNLFAYASMSSRVKVQADRQYSGRREITNYYLAAVMHKTLSEKFEHMPERRDYHKKFLAFMSSVSSKEQLRRVPPELRKMAKLVCSWGF